MQCFLFYYTRRTGHTCVRSKIIYRSTCKTYSWECLYRRIARQTCVQSFCVALDFIPVIWQNKYDRNHTVAMIFISGLEQLLRQTGSRRKSSCKRVHFFIRKAGIRVTRSRAIPHKARLTALHAICVQIFRHIAQKSLAIRQYACGISKQSVEKSDDASYAQALFSVSLILQHTPLYLSSISTKFSQEGIKQKQDRRSF